MSGRKQKEYANNNAPVLYKYKSVGSQLKFLYPKADFCQKLCLTFN